TTRNERGPLRERDSIRRWADTSSSSDFVTHSTPVDNRIPLTKMSSARRSRLPQRNFDDLCVCQPPVALGIEIAESVRYQTLEQVRAEISMRRLPLLSLSLVIIAGATVSAI